MSSTSSNSANVALFVATTLAQPLKDVEQLVDTLVEAGLDRIQAELLLAFVPIACAHVVYLRQGVRFQAQFVLWDSDSGARATGLLADEPVFCAAIAAAEQDFATSNWVQQIASMSAEHATITSLTTSGASPAGCVLTEPLLPRIPPSYLTKSASQVASVNAATLSILLGFVGLTGTLVPLLLLQDVVSQGFRATLMVGFYLLHPLAIWRVLRSRRRQRGDRLALALNILALLLLPAIALVGFLILRSALE